MQRVIHSSNTSHNSTATSVINLARAYQEFGQLQKAVVMQQQSLDMKRAICATNTAHPETVYSFRDLSNVNALLGSVQMRFIIRKKVPKCRESSATSLRRQRNLTLSQTTMK